MLSIVRVQAHALRMASQISGAGVARNLPIHDDSAVEHEFDLIRSAVALLATGGARRVTLVGLPLDDEALRHAGALVRAGGMLMRATPGQVGSDITIEASG